MELTTITADRPGSATRLIERNHMGLGGMSKLRDRKDRQRAKKERDKTAAAARGAARKAAKKR